MSMKPLIFVSAVSRELKTARQLVANTLTALGYEPVWQDIFETRSDDIRPMLRQKIDSCSAVLQIVGDAFGAEPPVPDKTFGRVSYTQYEALYAKSRRKKVYYLIAQHDLPRDATPDALDLPLDESPEAIADAAQRRRLQRVYREGLLGAEQIYYPVNSHPETELSVRRLRDDLAKLRRGFRAWMVGISAALVLIAGGVLFVQYQQRVERDRARVEAERQERERFAQQQEREKQELERKKQEDERLAAEANRKAVATAKQIHLEYAEDFLEEMLKDKETPVAELRERAIASLTKRIKLPREEIIALIDQKLPKTTPEAPISALDRARQALAQGRYDDVFQAADDERAEGRELAMLEGTAALAKFRETPKPEWQERALAAFRRAFALSDQTKEPKAWTDAAISSAAVLGRLARYAEAEALLVNAQRIQEDQHGKDSPEVALVINNLAQLLQATNRLAEAEPLMRRALAIDEQSYGEHHPTVARDLNNLAALLLAMNRLAEAEPLIRQALAIDKRSYGDEHPEVARHLSVLALLLQDTNRLTEAEPLMRRALVIDERSYGDQHPTIAIRLNNLATLLLYSNRLAQGYRMSIPGKTLGF